MELTYEERLQLDNSKEHLKVVLSNVRIASEKLTLILNDIKIFSEKLENLKLENIRVSSETNDIKKDILSKKAIQDRREISLLERENNIKRLDAELELSVSKTKKELEDINRQILLSQSNYENIIRGKKNEVKTLEDKIETLKNETKQCEAKITERFELSDNLEKEVEKLNEEIKEKQKILTKFINESDLAVKEITKTIDGEREKIKNPLMLIKTEQEKLDTKKKDLDIIRLRLSNQFKAQNPDKLLPIELKED